MGQPAAKQGDQIVATDTHIVLVPSPGGPVPTPLPHPPKRPAARKKRALPPKHERTMTARDGDRVCLGAVAGAQDHPAGQGGLDRREHVVAVQPQHSARELLRSYPMGLSPRQVRIGAGASLHGRSLPGAQAVAIPDQLQRRRVHVAAAEEPGFGLYRHTQTAGLLLRSATRGPRGFRRGSGG